MVHSRKHLRHVVLSISILASMAVMGQNAAVYIAQGDAYMEEGKSSKALEEYDKAVKVDKNARTLSARARATYAMGKMDRFLLDVEQALKLDSTHAEANYQRAQYALRSSDTAAVEEHATKAIAYARDSLLRARSHLMRGEARAEQNRTAAAISDLEIGLAKVTDAAASMSVLAQLYDATGRYEDALEVLERLCMMEPDDIGHWTNRSFELIQLERYDDALTMVQRALIMDKDEPVALSNRAYINLKMGRDKEALSDVERSLKNYPANPYALRTRALLRLKRGEREKACNDLTLAQVLGTIAEVEQLVQEHCGNTTPGKKKKK